jgi:hypothetical protein
MRENKKRRKDLVRMKSRIYLEHQQTIAHVSRYGRVSNMREGFQTSKKTDLGKNKAIRIESTGAVWTARADCSKGSFFGYWKNLIQALARKDVESGCPEVQQKCCIC